MYVVCDALGVLCFSLVLPRGYHMVSPRPSGEFKVLGRIGTGISVLRQAREFLFFPLPPSEASKRVPIFDRGTRTKLEGSDPPAWSSA